MAKKTVIVESKLNDKFVLESTIRGHKVVIDQPAQSGGTDTGVTPLELMLASLAGCIGTVGRIIAMQKRLEIRGMTLRVEGELDLDGLLGKPIEGRNGFECITISVDIDADLSSEEKEALVHEMDMRCPVSENLVNVTPVIAKSV